MADYLLFTEKESYGDHETLGAHLEDIANYAGTPDCWDTVECRTRNHAMNYARETGMHLYVVDELSMRVVGIVGDKKEEV